MDNQELLNQIAAIMEEQTKHVDEQFKSIEIKIENEITKRIDTLFDGYKLTHEKQWELEKKIETLEKRTERLEIAG